MYPCYFQKENEKMKITLKIEGMMCPHCEARVKKVLESLEQIESAEVSHKEKSAVVTLREDVDVSVLEKLVEDQGYTIIK